MVIIGVEPEDIETQSLELTATVQAQVDPIIDMVLAELGRLACPGIFRYADKK